MTRTRRCRGSRRRARACACGGCPRTSRRAPRAPPRARSFSASVLNSTRRQPQHLERVREQEELRLDVRAGAPGRRVEPRPADLDRAVLGPQREEARRADDSPVAARRSRAGARSRRGRGERLVARRRSTRRASAAGRRSASARSAGRATPAQSPSSCSGASGSSRTMRPSSDRYGSTRSTRRDSTLGPCRSTSTRAWSASRTSRSSSARRPGRHLPRVRRREGAEAVLHVRRPRRASKPELRRPDRAAAAAAAAAAPAAAATDATADSGRRPERIRAST